MFTKSFKSLVEENLAKADVHLNGKRPWDLQVHDERFYQDVAIRGTLGMGESYMRGWYDCDQLDECVCRILKTNTYSKCRYTAVTFLKGATALLFNKQSKSRAFEVGQKHYDIGNDLFQCMLDKRMAYSCAYWKEAKDLDAAQEAKLDLICRKLSLKKGQKILDIGCGWGSFVKYAAERYGVQAVGITVSKEQLDLAKNLCEGLPVELRLQDYRDLNETFDHIISVGQFEHVGCKNYRTYMKVAERCLKDDGLFLLHTIGNKVSVNSGDPWLEKYIFPNGMLPSISQIARACEKLFLIEDLHNFGAYYDPTLMAWYHNFKNHWNTLKVKYNEQFYRMWSYYLLTCAGVSRSRYFQLWQIVLSKHGVLDGYISIR
jgi:cyclopropane-fatty-acyl-phospholipid synthase